MVSPRAPVPVSPQESLEVSPPRGVCFLKDGQAVYLPKAGETMSLGRDPKNSVVFSEGDVSRRHAEVAEKDGSYYLRDLGSSNGTFLNQQALPQGKWVEFRPGDSLRLGSEVCLDRSQHDLPEQLPELKLPGKGEALTVGRSPDNGLQLAWPDSSRSHAVIQEKDGQSWILDKNSSNGTFVNGRKIPSQQWVVLNPGHKVQFGYSPQAAFNVAAPTAAPPAQGALKTSLAALSAQQGLALLSKAQFAPNPMGVRAMGAPDCTQEFLKTQGLEPRTTFECGDQKVHFSQAYTLGDQRAACVGYVEDKNGQVQVRAFYRSNSQGLWRAASHAGMGGWIGKGVGEESTNLPIALQAALHNQAGTGLKNVDEATAHQAFYGSLEFAGHAAPQLLQDQLKPAQEIGQFQVSLPDGHGRPESYTFKNPGMAADFSKVEARYTFDHPVHGKISADCYTSKNGECSYMFYRDSHNRSWLAQMEKADSPLTSWGTRAQPIEHGDLAMPAVEYRQQIPQGYAGVHVTGSYADASAYVHKLPLVADYRQSLGLT